MKKIFTLIIGAFFIVLSMYATEFETIQKIVATNRAANMRFGWNTSISGDYAIVGTNHTVAGKRAYIFKKNGATWSQVKQIVAADGNGGSNYGKVVSIYGDIAVVGASTATTDGQGLNPLSGAGAVYIYYRNQGGADNWGQIKKIVPSDRRASDEFGHAVSISGDYIVVSAKGQDFDANNENELSNAGAAYIFKKDAGGVDNWGQIKKLVAPDRAVDDGFGGYTINLSGELLSIGSIWNQTDANGENPITKAGAVYLFYKNQGGEDNWGLEKKIVSPDRFENEGLGWSSYISGDYLIASSTDPLSYHGGTGTARIFHRHEGGINNWGQVKKITHPEDGAMNLGSGSSVTMFNDYAAIGDYVYSGGVSLAGCVYLYKRDEVGEWNLVRRITAPVRRASDYFGTHVSLSNGHLIIGAWSQDTNVADGSSLSNPGSAYIYWSNPLVWTGAEDTVWHKASNWDPNLIPYSIHDVTIPDVPNQPVVSAQAACNKITINANASVTLDYEPNSILTVGTQLTNNGSLIIKSNDVNTGKIKNDGTTVNTGIVTYRKDLNKAAGWQFISFPYDVPASNITFAGTDVLASWGDTPYDAENEQDFYVLQYNAQERDATGVSTSFNSAHWVNVPEKEFNKIRGYIIAASKDTRIDFTSNPAETTMFSRLVSKSLQKFETNPIQRHRSWNLVGQPFLYAHDLKYSTQTHAPFHYFNGVSYDAVMANQSNQVPPFSAFFLQAHGPSADMTYFDDGRKLRTIRVDDFEEITLWVKDNAEVTYKDKTRIRLQEGASADYEIGKDAFKVVSIKAQVPQIYTRTNGENYAVNAIPTNTTIVDLVVTTGKAGSYTISLDNVDDVVRFSAIYLVVGSKEYNLLEQDYTFTSSKAGTKNWKIKLVAGVVTGINGATTDVIAVVSNNKTVVISGLQGTATVSVFDTHGKLLQLIENVQNNQALTINNTGVSVLSITTATQQALAKVLVE